jgi:regulator of sigma E protease
MLIEKSGFFEAVSLSFKNTANLIVTTFVGFVKLFSGKLSLKSLGGPIMIFKVARESYDLGGLINFFRMIAILSVMIGLINLFPIPILDGGHILLFFIEKVKGSPIGIRKREIAQSIGLIIILSLMVFAFYNDIMRIWF